MIPHNHILNFIDACLLADSHIFPNRFRNLKLSVPFSKKLIIVLFLPTYPQISKLLRIASQPPIITNIDTHHFLLSSH